MTQLYHIYFVACPGATVKVGYTRELRERMYMLASEKGRPVRLLATVPTFDKRAERVFHGLLDPWRDRRRSESLEYFRVRMSHIEWAISQWLENSTELLKQCGAKRTHPTWLHDLAQIQAPADLFPDSKKKR